MTKKKQHPEFDEAVKVIDRLVAIATERGKELGLSLSAGVPHPCTMHALDEILRKDQVDDYLLLLDDDMTITLSKHLEHERSKESEKRRLETARTGASATRKKADTRRTEIRAAYSKIREKHGELPRWWLIEQTIKHFQGDRKHPRRNYGSTTVKNATKGL